MYCDYLCTVVSCCIWCAFPHVVRSRNSETNLFGKLKTVQNRTTHRLCEQRGSDSTAGGRHTHTDSHTHTHTQNGGFDKKSR